MLPFSKSISCYYLAIPTPKSPKRKSARDFRFPSALQSTIPSPPIPSAWETSPDKKATTMNADRDRESPETNRTSPPLLHL